VYTEVNTPAGLSFPDIGLDDGAKTPTLQSSLFGGPANVSLLSTIRSGEIWGDAEDGAILQLTFPFISCLPALPLDDDISVSAIPLSFLGEICDNPIPTIEVHEDNSGYGKSERTLTGHSPSPSECDSSGRPARRLKTSLHNASECSWTVDLECSSSEGGFALEGQPTKGNKEDLTKLRITKGAFVSDFGSSFSSRESGGSANLDVLTSFM
jgi:hypothetical protein